MFQKWRSYFYNANNYIIFGLKNVPFEMRSIVFIFTFRNKNIVL